MDCLNLRIMQILFPACGKKNNLQTCRLLLVCIETSCLTLFFFFINSASCKIKSEAN